MDPQPEIDQPPIVPAPIPESAPKSKSWLIILLVIFCLASLAAASYFYYQNKQLKKLAIVTPPTPTLLPTIAPISDAPESGASTAGWQTYTNSSLGFSFQYPKDFSLKQDGLQKTLTEIPSPGKNFLNLTSPQCSLSLMINPDGFGPFFPNFTQKVSYDDEKGLVVTDSIPNTENLTPNKHLIIVSGQDLTKTIKGVFLNVICDKSYASQINSLLPQILSTFQFSENVKAAPTSTPKPISIPNDWKKQTATDSYYGLTTNLTLPPDYTFAFTGSETTISSSDQKEVWEMITSLSTNTDGIIHNSYDNSSRRSWYEKMLQGSNSYIAFPNAKIISVKEIPINNSSALAITLNLNPGTVTHYLVVNHGIVHIFRPISEAANANDSNFTQNIAAILNTLFSTWNQPTSP